MAFSFSVMQTGAVGAGARADSDVVDCSLLDVSGRTLRKGVVVMATLSPGTYLLSLHAPPDSRPVRVRPVLVGTKPPGTGPPEDVIRHYLRLAAGLPDEVSRSTQVAAPTGEESPAEDEGQPDEEPASQEEPQQ